MLHTYLGSGLPEDNLNEEEYFGIINDSSVNNQSESDTSTESNIDEPEEHWDINSEDIRF